MTLSEFYKIYGKEIDSHIFRSLKEDKVNHDITTDLVFDKDSSKKVVTAHLLCKENCILAGRNIFIRVFRILYPRLSYKAFYKDGDSLKKGSVVLTLKAPVRVLLKGERTALNYLQRMSGVATLTDKFVSRLKYSGSKILHTRKTTPQFRLFEIAAVKIGGGDFHRIDLSSAVMIKDNHIEALGGIKNTIQLIQKKRLTGKQKNRFEIEVKSIEELIYVLKNAKNIIKIVMLDNFDASDTKKALKLLINQRIKVELSGGITLDNFSINQLPGIDYYSIGSLTHGYKSVDYSLEF